MSCARSWASFGHQYAYECGHWYDYDCRPWYNYQCGFELDYEYGPKYDYGKISKRERSTKKRAEGAHKVVQGQNSKNQGVQAFGNHTAHQATQGFFSWFCFAHLFFRALCGHSLLGSCKLSYVSPENGKIEKMGWWKLGRKSGVWRPKMGFENFSLDENLCFEVDLKFGKVKKMR